MSCDRCQKFVALPEQRRACNKVYHIDCFLCGGSNSDGCGKRMNLDNYTDKGGQPYCKVCYGRLFGPKVFMNGTANFNVYDESVPRATAPVPAPAPVIRAPPPPPPVRNSVKPAAPAPTYYESSEPAAQQSLGRLVNDRNKPAIASEVLPGRGVVSSARSNFNPGAVVACAFCGRSVTLAEERRACDQTWHIDCFICGGKAGDGCGKKLTLDKYMANKGDPYCSHCHNKNFGARGFIGGSSTINTYDDQPAKVAPTRVAAVPKPAKPAPRVVTSAAVAAAAVPASPVPVAAPPPVRAPGSVTTGTGGRLVNDRHAPATTGDVLPGAGSVRAALQNLKRELPKNA